MKHFVTLCVTDGKVGSNFLWHGEFFLSIFNEETEQVDVTAPWTYEGAPSAGDPNHWWTRIKRKFAVDTDFTGTHGWLKQEEYRFLDRGHGLHGYTFELTAADYKKLEEECARRVKEQQDAVRESLGDEALRAPEISKEAVCTDLVSALAAPAGEPVKKDKIRCYAGERRSDHAYKVETHKSRVTGQPSRLHPFNLSVGLTRWGRPTFKGSHTCKSEALDILGMVLTKEQLAPFQASTFPRFVSGAMEDIILHSVGPLNIYTSPDGNKSIYRNGETPGVKLVWTIPPQKVDPRPGTHMDKRFAVDNEYCAEVRVVVTKLQRLEWLLINAVLPEKYRDYQAGLVNQLFACYRTFSIVRPKAAVPKKEGGVIGWGLSLFGIAQTQEQKELQKNIQKAKYLFNELYMALVDGVKIQDDLPCETEVSDDAYKQDFNPLAALVGHLSEADQRMLCSILGRSYTQPEIIDEDEFELPPDLVAAI